MVSSFAFPTKILCGVPALDELPAQLTLAGTKKPLVVTDPGLLATGAYGLLREALGGDPALFMGVHPNPIEADVHACAEAYRAAACDGVIGFGGGSALDVAKIACAAVAGEGDWGSLTWEVEVGPLPPFFAIPTTAGTGSEVGRSSVIIFDQAKRVIFHPALLARVVILDPRLTTGLPPKLTAATGVDALTHCIEAVTSPVPHPLCEAIALEGARIALAHLAGAVEQGEDLGHREQMQVAALMGGIAFQKDLGAAHSLSHPLSAHFGVHHGLANGLCLPPVMRWNARRKPGVYERLAVATGAGRTDADFIGAVEALLERIGITGGLRGQNIPEGALAMLAQAAFADACHRTNPVPVSEADLLALYQEAMG